MSEKIHIISYNESNTINQEDQAIMDIQGSPTAAIIFSLNYKEVLKLEPGKATAYGETITDTKEIFERLDAWIKKVESFGKK